MSDSRVHAFTDDALGDMDSVGVAAAIAAGEISSREAVEASIARAERLDPMLNMLAVRDFERALDQSTSPGPGPFSGVPSVIKDNTDVAGLPTVHGSEAVAPREAKADAPFTTQMRATGVVVIGKSTMPEFGFNASTEFEHLPPTRNPWTRSSPVEHHRAARRRWSHRAWCRSRTPMTAAARLAFPRRRVDSSA